MNFEGLKHRVERAEALVDGRVGQTSDRYRALRVNWREAWTPPRILIAGLLAGFITGNLEPRRALTKLGKLGGPKSLQLISSIAGLMSSIQATVAAATAEKAAETADDAAENVAAHTTGGVAGTQAATAAAGAAAGVQANQAAPAQPASTTAAPRPATQSHARPIADRGRPDPVLSEQPRAAEAATDVSESDR